METKPLKTSSDKIEVASTACSSQQLASDSSPTDNSASNEVTSTSILETIKNQKEWVKTIVFESDGRIVAATVMPFEGEVEAFLKLYNNREHTIASGIILLNEQYDVHRYHPPLIYGRRGDPALGEGEGIAICRVEKKSSKEFIYCLITYVYPTLSARAVPQLQDFCEKECEFCMMPTFLYRLSLYHIY